MTVPPMIWSTLNVIESTAWSKAINPPVIIAKNTPSAMQTAGANPKMIKHVNTAQPAEECGCEHHAFDTDVDHACTFAKYT